MSWERKHVAELTGYRPGGPYSVRLVARKPSMLVLGPVLAGLRIVAHLCLGFGCWGGVCHNSVCGKLASRQRSELERVSTSDCRRRCHEPRSTDARRLAQASSALIAWGCWR